MASRSKRHACVCSKSCPINCLAIFILVCLAGFVAITIWGLVLVLEDGDFTSSPPVNQTCALDFCREHDLDRVVDRHGLLISYIAAGVLLLLYAWEKNPVHRCVAMENVYKVIVIMICYTATFAWEEGARVEAMISGSIRIRQTLFRLSVIILLISYADIDRWLPAFFDRPSAREILKLKSDRKCHPHGARCSTELNELMLSMVGEDRDISGRSVALMIFIGLIVEELGLAFPNHMDTYLQLVSNAFTVVLWMGVLWWVVWVLRTRRRSMQRLQTLTAKLVPEHPKGFRHMLHHVNVPTLLNLGGDEVADVFMDALDQDMLDTACKAIIIDAFAKCGHMTSSDQRCVADLILSCSGDDLLLLKALLDGSGGYHNLEKLVFGDIRDPETRTEILQHFDKEADSLLQSRGCPVGTKVLSDMDDTLLSSAGHYPAGCDKSYPHKVIYPGCLKFYQCLDTGFDPAEPSCNLIFLSARPHVYKDLAEQKSYAVFHALKGDGLLHSIPTLLAGKLLSGLWATLTVKCIGVRGWKCVGNDKFETFNRFTQLYPEYDYVFCGDDGQGDLLAGQLMLEQSSSKGSVRGVVIHEVLQSDDRLEVPPEDSSDDEDSRLIFHKTYVGAAIDFHSIDPQLFPLQKVKEVAEAAVQDWQQIAVAYHSWLLSEAGLAAERLLQADLCRAEALLQAGNAFRLINRNRLMT
eukprot:TRINITY_DN63987_c0_g1_i1.p1 TRINITY_DN63987_c0_g1~~TRINITY_DN63987_c0_g1_i1.p1  ORF type:complete len:721 (-),score=97.00 TRINITY_DN63987_c0_g1_i1:47-2128(-)